MGRSAVVGMGRRGSWVANMFCRSAMCGMAEDVELLRLIVR
jgi:tRNA A37 threonylcarbamoyladenosine dehydratase